MTFLKTIISLSLLFASSYSYSAPEDQDSPFGTFYSGVNILNIISGSLEASEYFCVSYARPGSDPSTACSSVSYGQANKGYHSMYQLAFSAYLTQELVRVYTHSDSFSSTVLADALGVSGEKTDEIASISTCNGECF